MTPCEHRPERCLRLVLPVVIAAVICCVFLILKKWYPSVRFDSELVRVRVDPDRITVEGLYQLYNPLPFPMIQSFFYPVPEGGGLEPAGQILMESTMDRPGSGSEPLTPVRRDSLNIYTVMVAGRSALHIRARYSQRHNGRFGRYILTTTGSWERPLSSASFEMVLDSVDLIRSNYPLRRGDDGIWIFQRTDFMPNEDWLFTFERSRGKS